MDLSKTERWTNKPIGNKHFEFDFIFFSTERFISNRK